MSVSHRWLWAAVTLLLALGPTRAQLPRTHDLTWFQHSSHWPLDGHHQPAAPWRPDSSMSSSGGGQQPDAASFTSKVMKELSAACRQNPICAKKTSLDKVSCVRKCVSASCYSQLYGSDPLEPGEIDVRYEHYHHCFHTHWLHKAKAHITTPTK